MQRLSDISTIRAVMEKNGFSFSKALGQNFLINPSVCPRMAEMSGAADCAGPLGYKSLSIGAAVSAAIIAAALLWHTLRAAAPKYKR